MTQPEARRHEAVNTTVYNWLNANADYVLISGATREGIAAQISGLASLGRSKDWKTAIARWADMVTDANNDLRWALLQGSTGATTQA